jgi:hypothetical protein
VKDISKQKKTVRVSAVGILGTICDMQDSGLVTKSSGVDQRRNNWEPACGEIPWATTSRVTTWGWWKVLTLICDTLAPGLPSILA